MGRDRQEDDGAEEFHESEGEGERDTLEVLSAEYLKVSEQTLMLLLKFEQDIFMLPRKSFEEIKRSLRGQPDNSLEKKIDLLAGIFLNKEYNSLAYKFKRGFAAMGDKMHALGTALGTGFEKLKSAFKALGNAIAKAWQSVKTFFTTGRGADAIKEVKAAMKSFGEAIKSFFKEVLAPALEKVAEPVKRNVLNAISHIDEKVIAPLVEKIQLAQLSFATNLAPAGQQTASTFKQSATIEIKDKKGERVADDRANRALRNITKDMKSKESANHRILEGILKEDPALRAKMLQGMSKAKGKENKTAVVREVIRKKSEGAGRSEV